MPNRYGENNSRWKGGRIISGGYSCLYKPEHPDAINSYVSEARLFAETALGKLISSNNPIHHLDEAKGSIMPKAIVICEDNAYHRLLHQRHHAFNASGHGGWLKCHYCKNWDDPKNLYLHPTKSDVHFHRNCQNEYLRKQRRKYSTGNLCFYCGKELSGFKSEKRKFCNNSCGSKYNNSRRKRIINA